MAKGTKGKFEVDVTALDLSEKELIGLEQAINKAVLGKLATTASIKPDIGRVFGRPGHTQGLWIVQRDLSGLGIRR